ncbi:MAG: ABC transporter ATP-binding protein [Patescibacteria group bacterium]
MNVLEVKNLTKKFGRFTAVDDISFSLKEGEILGLLGANGAGKTTTIQMLLGVLNPTGGQVMYFGKDLGKHREEILEEVNFSSTYTNMPWELTVRENLAWASYLYKIKDRKKRIEEMIDIFRLRKLVKDKTTGLSSGQITRLNLAKAFINYPRVLLLDEPTASLDPDVASYIRKFLLKEKTKFQVSIIFTSHNMAEVEEMCDRVIFINEGKIIADDTPINLAKTMKTSHVRLLVGRGTDKLKKYCEAKNMKCKLNGKALTVDMDEKEIPFFLREIMDQGVLYDEISIDKPTLNDYFLQIIKPRKDTDAKKTKEKSSILRILRKN